MTLLAGCEKRESSPLLAKDPPANSAPSTTAPDAIQGWQGTWNGPEGTYLKLTAKPDSRYEIIIRNLDGERSFEGVGGADHIRFTRDGQLERIRATDGAATGMKWLADKSECLTVKPGEGYCRE